MRTTSDSILFEPVRVHRTQNTKGVHMRLGMKNVVDNTLKVECIVGVIHNVVTVGSFEFKRMNQNIGSFGTTHFA